MQCKVMSVCSLWIRIVSVLPGILHRLFDRRKTDEGNIIDFSVLRSGIALTVCSEY
jgi:hypothetical protein